jgi:hypothetical protein
MHYTYLTADVNMEMSVTLLKQINKPSLLLSYEQMYIEIFHRNNELIPEQHPNTTPCLNSSSTPRMPHTSLKTNQCFHPPVSPLSTGALYGQLQR